MELTKREIEILRLVGKGYANREIGEKIGVSARTVESHLYRAFLKLRAVNRAQAVIKFAKRVGNRRKKA